MFNGRTSIQTAIVLAIALTIAQIGALAHGYSHLQNPGGGPDRTALHSALCADCASFGAVLAPGAASADGFAVPIGSVAGIIEDHPTLCRTDAIRHYFEAQGPPSLR